MTSLFLNTLSVSAVVSAIILLILLFFAALGRRVTAKCRYILWAIVIFRLALPFSVHLLPSFILLEVSEPSVTDGDIDSSAANEGAVFADGTHIDLSKAPAATDSTPLSSVSSGAAVNIHTASGAAAKTVSIPAYPSSSFIDSRKASRLCLFLGKRSIPAALTEEIFIEND